MKKLLLLSTFLISLSGFSQIWQNDFSNPTDWISSDLNAGTDSWIISSSAIGGDVDSISSATSVNGFAQFNSEGQCGSGHQDVTLTYFQPIDLTTNQLSYLQFVQHYKRKSDTVYVEFSNDNLTWESIRINRDYWYYQQTENPDTVQVSIPSTIQSQPFYLRFKFQGECGFAWLMDDLMIFEKEQYAAKIESDIRINGLYYSEINQCISDTLDVHFEIENFGYDTLFDVVIKTDIYRDAVFDFTRFDTISIVNRETIFDTTFINVVTDPFNIDVIESISKVYATSLDTFNTNNIISINDSYTKMHDEIAAGSIISDANSFGAGNIYTFSEPFCPVRTEFYIPNDTLAVDKIVYLTFYRKSGTSWIYNGQTADYSISLTDLDTWVTPENWIYDPYLPGDTALIIYSTYGDTLPIPYSQKISSGNSYFIDEFFSPQIELEGHVVMINLAPFDSYYCEQCYGSLDENPNTSLQISPNPASSEIQIQNLTEPISSLNIISIDGREMYFEKNPQSEKITVAFLESGTYLIFVETDDGTIYSEKFVKL